MKNSITLGAKLERIVDAVGDVAQHLWDKGWAESNAGNISVNVTESLPDLVTDLDRFQVRPISQSYPSLSGCCLLISGAGTRMRDLARRPAENACLLRLADEADSYQMIWGGAAEGGFRPTSELASHLSLHQFLLQQGRSDRAVVHTHPTELIALTHRPEYNDQAALNRALWGMLPEVKILLPEGLAVVPYQRPGSEALAQATVKALPGRQIALWEKHGCLAVAPTPTEAFDLIDMANKAAQIFLTCQGAGFTPEGLTASQIQELADFFGPKERSA